MKKLLGILLFSLLAVTGFAQVPNYSPDYVFIHQVGIGKEEIQSTNPSAWLEIGKDGTNRGLIIPRVNDTLDVASPVKGLVIFLNADSTIRYYTNYWKAVGQQDLSAYLTKAEAEGRYLLIQDTSDLYHKVQVDDLLDKKADKTEIYTQSQIDNMLGGKADKTESFLSYDDKIPSSTNLNSFVKFGTNPIFSTTTGLTNTPDWYSEGNTALLNNYVTSSYRWQSMINVSTGQPYQSVRRRGSSGGSWSPWYDYAFRGDGVSQFVNDSGYLTDNTGVSREFFYSGLNSNKKIEIKYYTTNTIHNISVDNGSTDATAVVDKNGDVYIGGVDNEGWATITVIRRSGTVFTRRIYKLNTAFNYPTDTHTSPALLIDTSRDAEYPLMVFQNDHSTDNMTRYWRFGSLSIEFDSIPSVEYIPNGSTTEDQVTYNMVYRWGNKIYVFNRMEGATPNLYTKWRVCYSPDNGDSWVQRAIFDSSPTTDYMYMYCSQIENSPIVNIGVAASGNGDSKKALYLRLNMASGELSNITSILVSDVPDYIANSTATIDPFTSGLLLEEPSGSGERAASPNISTNESGNLVALIHHIYANKQALDIVEFDRNTGSIISTKQIDETATGGSYNSKMLLYNDSIQQAYSFMWDQIYKDNSKRAMYGNSVAKKIDLSDLNNISSAVFLTSHEKIDRAKPLSDYSGFVFVETSWEANPIYSDFDGSLYVERFGKDTSRYLGNPTNSVRIYDTPPASATAPGTKGEIRVTADYIYVCIDTDTWVRCALETW